MPDTEIVPFPILQRWGLDGRVAAGFIIEAFDYDEKVEFWTDHIEDLRGRFIARGIDPNMIALIIRSYTSDVRQRVKQFEALKRMARRDLLTGDV